MKDKFAHFMVAFIGLGISMAVITYLFKGEVDWYLTVIFALLMGLADVFLFKKLRERKN